MNASLFQNRPRLSKLRMPRRMHAEFSVFLTTPDGTEIECRTDTLSRGEISVSLTLEDLTRILPNRCTRPDEIKHVELSLVLPSTARELPSGFALPDLVRAGRIDCKAAVHHVRRQSRTSYLLTLAIESLSRPDLLLLENLLDRLQRADQMPLSRNVVNRITNSRATPASGVESTARSNLAPSDEAAARPAFCKARSA